MDTQTRFVGVVSETHFANRFSGEKTRASKEEEKRKEGEKIVSE